MIIYLHILTCIYLYTCAYLYLYVYTLTHIYINMFLQDNDTVMRETCQGPACKLTGDTGHMTLQSHNHGDSKDERAARDMDVVTVGVADTSLFNPTPHHVFTY